MLYLSFLVEVGLYETTITSAATAKLHFFRLIAFQQHLLTFRVFAVSPKHGTAMAASQPVSCATIYTAEVAATASSTV